MTSGVDALLSALPRGLPRGADLRAVVVTQVQDVDATSGRVLASLGGEAAWLLAITDDYAVGDLVAAMRNPWTGRAEVVLGRVPDGALNSPALPADPTVETTTTVLSATTTGTYAASARVWDDDAVRQGSRPEAGRLIGLATYGRRVADLRALSIEKLEVLLRDVPNDGGIAPVSVAVAHHQTRPPGAPVASGVVLTAPLASGDTQWLPLNVSAEQLEAFRTGALAGLVLTGVGYRALRPRDVAGMSLRVTYSRRA